MVEYSHEAQGEAIMPGIQALGHISKSDDLAQDVINKGGVIPLKDALMNSPEVQIKTIAAESLRQMGRHSNDHAQKLAESGVLTSLLSVYMSYKRLQNDDDILGSKQEPARTCKKALKDIILQCNYLPALYPLLQHAPEQILKYVCEQFAKMLAQNVEAKKQFIQSGSFQLIQTIEARPVTKLRDYIDQINEYFPPDVVEYYSPGYAEKLIDNLDKHQSADL